MKKLNFYGAPTPKTPVWGDFEAEETILWSPDSTMLAHMTPVGLRVHVWDSKNNEHAVELNDSTFVEMEWSPDGTYLAALGWNDIWWIYKRQNDQFELVRTIESPSPLGWPENDQIVYIPSRGGLVLIYLRKPNVEFRLAG